MFLSKYGDARVIEIPIIKRAVVDFAVGADWTPAAGDVKISKDGGAAANVTNLPTAIAMGNGAIWSFSLTATEIQAARVVVTVADSATKAVEDQAFVIETYGNASAQHAFDLDTASTAQTGDSFARLGAPAGASTAADIAAVKVDTAATLADTGTDGVVVAAASKTGYALSAAGVQAIWDALTTALTTVGSIGKLLVDRIDAAISSRGTGTALDAAGVRSAVGLASANLDTQLDALPTAAEIVAAQNTTAITEAYRANGAAPTPAQFMSEVLAHLGESSISGTTKTIKKLDHATAAATFTLDDANTPASITRAT